MQKIKDAVLLLCSENPLPPRYRDHARKGRFEGYRECHLEFDWLLIYKKDRGRLLLFLTHTGTHADLFGE